MTSTTHNISYNPQTVLTEEERRLKEMRLRQQKESTLPSTMNMRAISPQRPLPMDFSNNSSSPYSNQTMATSPSRLRSSSPRALSPASSLIFERNVQENSVPDEMATAIPAHIRVDQHVPAVLEASSLAITNDQLRPDQVEIVTHTVHQPAAKTLTTNSGYNSGHVSPHEENASPGFPISMERSLSSLSAGHDNTSTYGSIDPTDVRRLSFISFADVVQGENVEHGGHNSRDSILHMALSDSFHSSSPSFAMANRSPSPLSVRSNHMSNALYGAPSYHSGPFPSPPLSVAPSVAGMDLTSKMQQPPASLGSPISFGANSPPFGAYHHHPSSGDLVVETMAQAMRRTESADLIPTLSH